MNTSTKGQIIVTGARENNLKNIAVSIPKNSMTVITGLSGSGKSSLAFDTIYAEGQRRYIESLSTYARAFLDRYSKPDVDSIQGLSPSIAIDQKTVGFSPRSTVGTISEIYDFLRLLFAKIGEPICPEHKKPVEGQALSQIVEDIFSLPTGTKYIITSTVARNKKGEFQKEIQKWIKSGFNRAVIDGEDIELSDSIKLDKHKRHDIDVIIDKLISNKKDSLKIRIAESCSHAVNLSSGYLSVKIDKKLKNYSIHRACPDCGYSFPEIDPLLFSFNSPKGACTACDGLGTQDIEEFNQETYSVEESKRVVVPHWKVKGKKKSSDDDSDDDEFDEVSACSLCHGSGLNPQALNVFINSKNIYDISSLSLTELRRFIENLNTSGSLNEVLRPIKEELLNRINYLIEVGTGYLSLNRRANTLSGGEAQRIRLASQIGASLVGVLYVLDEPSIGLHPRDHERLLSVLKKIKTRGNTVIVVEHDEDTILAADYLVEIGPGAGNLGGKVLYSGSLNNLEEHGTLTGDYIYKKKTIPIPKKRRTGNGSSIEIFGASGNNLKNINVKIPLGCLISVSGVSGSGKSTLIIDTLYKNLSNKLHKSNHQPAPCKKISGIENIDKIIQINQKPIGRTPRSCPATYVGLFPLVRDLFSQLPDSKIRGYKQGQFSFNVKDGQCSNCMGVGYVKMQMHFLSDAFVDCDMCLGKRYNPETLNIYYKNKNISEVLNMTVQEAFTFFEAHSNIKRKLQTLLDVGLSYITLGQSSTSLSGGEAQRIKLSKELSKRSTGKTLYILDEPTTGLHFHDIAKLINLLHALTEQGNTVVVVEHNLELIKNSDFIIDIGPEGGIGGGTVVATGTPEEVVKNSQSLTGKFLKKIL